MSPTEVSAVVTNYNGGENVQRCVQALRESEHPLAQVIVVDNGSTDGSREQLAARFPGVQILEMGANLGLSPARNAGLRAVKTEYVLLLDDDVYVRADTVTRLLDQAAGVPKTILTPRILLYPDGDVVQAQGAWVHFAGLLQLHHGYQPKMAVPQGAEQVGGCIGACYFGRIQDFVTHGGFDDLFFFYNEDLEFSLRLRSLGYDFLTVPEAVVDHDRGAGTAGLSFRGQGSYPYRRAYYSMRHRWLTLLIHYQMRSLILLAPSLLLYELLGIGFFLRHGWGTSWLRVWGWLWGKRQGIRRRRSRMKRSRVQRDRDLLTGGELPFAPGLIESAWLRGVVQAVNFVLNLNWRIVRRLL